MFPPDATYECATVSFGTRRIARDLVLLVRDGPIMLQEIASDDGTGARPLPRANFRIDGTLWQQILALEPGYHYVETVETLIDATTLLLLGQNMQFLAGLDFFQGAPRTLYGNQAQAGLEAVPVTGICRVVFSQEFSARHDSQGDYAAYIRAYVGRDTVSASAMRSPGGLTVRTSGACTLEWGGVGSMYAQTGARSETYSRVLEKGGTGVDIPPFSTVRDFQGDYVVVGLEARLGADLVVVGVERGYTWVNLWPAADGAECTFRVIGRTQ